MATKQGAVSLINDPVAQSLLQSTNQAKLAYVWSDGTPRVVPIWFHWNGKEIVMCTPVGAPKNKVLKDGSKVAVTIDSPTGPWKVLYVRGSIKTNVVNGVAPEYAAAARRYLGEEAGNAWIKQVEQMPGKMAQIYLTPGWVGILDFETRFPSAMEAAMEGRG